MRRSCARGAPIIDRIGMTQRHERLPGKKADAHRGVQMRPDMVGRSEPARPRGYSVPHPGVYLPNRAQWRPGYSVRRVRKERLENIVSREWVESVPMGVVGRREIGADQTVEGFWAHNETRIAEVPYRMCECCILTPPAGLQMQVWRCCALDDDMAGRDDIV